MESYRQLNTLNLVYKGEVNVSEHYTPKSDGSKTKTQELLKTREHELLQ